MWLVHSGVRGMKHGNRRYQNEDGTWTELGKARRRAQYEMSHHPGENHKEEKRLPSSDANLVRKGQYWYNQNGEMMATQIYPYNIDRLGQNEANAVIQYMEKTGQWDRAIYDEHGVYALEIHPGPHHGKQQVQRHPPDGAHVHDHDERGIRLPEQNVTDGRGMTNQERKEHREIFKRTAHGGSKK